MKKILIILAIIGLVLFLVSSAHASTDAICGEGEHIGNPHCIVIGPSLTPTVTVTPTVTGTVTLTPTATVTPTTETNTGTQAGDGRGDGLGCGSHDCSVHVVVPQGAPATGHAW